MGFGLRRRDVPGFVKVSGFQDRGLKALDFVICECEWGVVGSGDLGFGGLSRTA